MSYAVVFVFAFALGARYGDLAHFMFIGIPELLWLTWRARGNKGPL